MSRTWTDEHTRRLNQACEARKAEGFCDVSCLFIGWCDYVIEDVRRADARGKGRGVREFALKFEQGVDAVALAKGRHGFLPGKSRKNVAAFACMCDAVLARNAIEDAHGIMAELRSLDGKEGR